MTEKPTPGGPIGRSMARPSARRLATGRGRYTDDLALPRMAHVAFVRSPLAHARVGAIDTADAAAMPGVIGAFTAADVDRVCRPWRAAMAHLPRHVSPEQRPLARDEVAFQGEAVAAVVAATRAEAEDAAERIVVDFEELPVVADPAAALAEGAAPVHTALGSNLAFDAVFEQGDARVASGSAATTVERRFAFGRVTGVPLEPRTILADHNPADRALTVHLSYQQPHMLQALLADRLGLGEHRVRVVAPDVGGAFGLKMHAYPDEMAVAAIAVLLGRPVKYVCDRFEAFMTDLHAREAGVTARLAVDGDGRIAALDADTLIGCGAYSVYPRTSLGEGMQVATHIGAAYEVGAFRSGLRMAYQNKAPTGTYRGVGQPLACAVTEQLLDDAAAAIDLDPAEIRRRNYRAADAYPATTPGGLRLGHLSLEACLDRLLERMDYAGLRREQAAGRERGIHRGIGLASFVEQTGVGPSLYGPPGIPITAQDGCTLRLEPTGVVRCAVGNTDQGQGTMAGIAQIVAAALDVEPETVAVASGDSDGPQGGGAWGSRGLSIGGEAAWRAGRALRERVLDLAAGVLQAEPGSLDLREGRIVARADGTERMGLAELCRLAYYRQDELPPDVQPELTVTRHFVPRDPPYAFANGVQACHLEVDVDTGAVALLGFWVVEDCGTLINPQLVDEQIRGGVVQGLGGALFEHLVYDADGQLQTSNLADYLVPMAVEMPDIVVDHVETPHAGNSLGIKGAGEAGTVGAAAAVWCALNDALRPLGARVEEQPFTPEVVLRALGRIEPD